jgi:hypothetical protein
MRKIILLILFALVAVIAWTAYEVVRNNAVEKLPARPDNRMFNLAVDGVLVALEEGREYDSAVLEDASAYVGHRYDCSDFRLQSMARILYAHRDSISEADYELIKRTFLEFKYWMDQPGNDSMCYWSENHQLLFATSEFLAGQYWPDEMFTNAWMSGRQHQAQARERILTWLELRWLYGFTEWYSNTYYVEDIAPLANLIDFADDEEIVVKAKIVLDLMLYDLASQSWKGTFISSSGRMYANGKRYPEKNGMQAVIDHIWDPARWGREPSDRVGMDQNFIRARNYEVPPVIRAIGKDDGRAVEIRASTGLDIDELEAEGLLGTEDRQIMMQWAMEAFSNPEIIENTMDYMNKADMFPNEFLHDLKDFNHVLLRYTGAMPAISNYLNPVTNGTAIQRANTYTWKTPDYMLASAQAYHPGSFGDQQHLWNAVLSREVSVFVTHPAKPLSAEGALSLSPGYWVGGGRLPHVAQDRNVVLNLFDIPEEPGFMEGTVQDFTHAHFPRERFDEVVLEGRYAFGRAGTSYAALIARNPLHYSEGMSDDLVQPGRESYWVFEAGSARDDGSFAGFMQRVRSNPVRYESGSLFYESSGRSLELRYRGDFAIDGEVQDLDYPRFDAPYVKAPRKPEVIRIEHDGKTLLLDFYGLKRVVGGT